MLFKKSKKVGHVATTCVTLHSRGKWQTLPRRLNRLLYVQIQNINSKCGPTTLFVIFALEGNVAPDILSEPLASLEVIFGPEFLS